MAEQINVENVVEFVSLLEHDDYEIQTEFPFIIRRKSDQYIISEYIANTGYPTVTLNRNKYLKHILIAKQFIENPNNYQFVDHISRNKTDYHLENLRWVTRTQNNQNKSSHLNIEYEFVTSIHEDSIHVTDYNNHLFNNTEYFFYNNVFYFYNGTEYRILRINENKTGNQFVNMRDDDGKCIKVYYSKFKRLYDIPFD